MLWAHHEPVYALEMRANVQVGEQPTDLFFIRWAVERTAHDVGTNQVIEYDSRRYRIMDAIDVDGSRRYIRISAKDIGWLDDFADGGVEDNDESTQGPIDGGTY